MKEKEQIKTELAGKFESLDKTLDAIVKGTRFPPIHELMSLLPCACRDCALESQGRG